MLEAAAHLIRRALPDAALNPQAARRTEPARVAVAERRFSTGRAAGIAGRTHADAARTRAEARAAKASIWTARRAVARGLANRQRHWTYMCLRHRNQNRCRDRCRSQYRCKALCTRHQYIALLRLDCIDCQNRKWLRAMRLHKREG
jgi:hypothetical protein